MGPNEEGLEVNSKVLFKHWNGHGNDKGKSFGAVICVCACMFHISCLKRKYDVANCYKC